MIIPEKELKHLLDMYNYCVIINDIVKHIDLKQFEKNKTIQMAVERGIEIIGEASNRLNKNTQESLPFIEWRDILGMRNRIVHEYGSLI